MTIDDILRQMHAKKASDLHLKAGTQPIIRRKGRLYLLNKEIPALSNEDIQNMIFPILTEKQKEKYKREKNLDFGHYCKDVGRFRFCAFSQKGTTRIVARLIAEKIPSFEDLSLPLSLKKLTTHKNGMILVTGATGSGKSTTTAAILDYINKKYPYHIITIEDPIEYIFYDHYSCISQREKGLDYIDAVSAFRSSLRQDPDIIFFGEIRDEKSMAVALQAAESGHLVISTLHTSTTVETFNRCLSFFEGDKQKYIKDQLINSLRAIVSQKLVPTIDGKLTPVVELFINNTRMKQALVEGKSNSELLAILEDSNETWGMQSFDQHIIKLIKKKIISKESGIQFASFPNNIRMCFDGFVSSKESTFIKSLKDLNKEGTTDTDNPLDSNEDASLKIHKSG